MSPQEIETVLKAHLVGTDLRLPADAFGAGAVATVLARYLPPAATLDVADAVLTPGDGIVTVAGAGTAAPFAGTRIEAVFDGTGAEIALRLRATAASGWRFDTAFDRLAGSVLELLDYDDVTLDLSSSAPEATALTLATKAKFNGDVGAIGWLLGDIASFALSGPITMTGTVPIFALQADLVQIDLQPLGSLTPAFQIASAALAWGPKASKIAAHVTIGLVAKVTVKGQSVPIFFDLSTPTSLVPITVDLSGVANLGLAELGSLVGGADLVSYVPTSSGFPGIKAVAGLDFLIVPAQRAIVSIGVEAGLSGDWPIRAGVDLTGGRMSFTILDPLGAKNIDASIEATVGWPGGTLGVGVAIAKTAEGLTGTLYAALREGSVVHINDVIGYFLSVDIPAVLDLDGLDLGITLPSLDWYFDTSLTGDWALPLGFTSIALTGASAALAHSGGQTNGSIAATATLAGIDFDVVWNLMSNCCSRAVFPIST